VSENGAHHHLANHIIIRQSIDVGAGMFGHWWCGSADALCLKCLAHLFRGRGVQLDDSNLLLSYTFSIM